MDFTDKPCQLPICNSYRGTKTALSTNDFHITNKIQGSPSDPTISSPQKIVDREILPWELWFLRLVRVSTALKSIPLAKMESDGVMRTVKSKFWFGVWYCRLICLTLDTIYLLFVSKTVTLAKYSEKDVLDFYLHTMSRLTASVVVWAIAAGLEGTVQVYNTLSVTQGIWKDKFGRYGSYFHGDLERNLGKAFKCTTIFATIQAIAPLILHLTGRQTPRYWGSKFLPSNVYNSIPGIVLFAAYDFSNSMMSIHGAVFSILLMLASFVLMQYWTTHIRSKLLKYGILSIIPVKQYRMLLCLNRFINQEVGRTIFPTLVSLGSIFVCVALCTMIKNMRELTVGLILSLLTGVPLMVLALRFIYNAGGEVISGSEEVKCLLNRGKDLLRQKQIKSLRNIKLYLGDFYYITKNGFIGHMQWIVIRTIDIILVL